MSQFFNEGGPFMWVLLFIGIALLTSALRTFLTVFRKNETVSHARINTVVFLGCSAFVTGVFAQLLGLYSAATAILRATAVSPQIIAEGVRISFNTTLAGLGELTVAMLLWLVLRAVAMRNRAASE